MASDLISHTEWIKRTSVTGRRRSPPLRKLDDALKMYDEHGGGDARWRVGQALKGWQESKGPGSAWKNSSRNKNNRAFEDLAKLLNNETREGDAVAYATMAQHRQDFIRQLFSDRKLVLSGKLITTYQSATSAYSTFQLGSRTEHMASNMAHKQISEELVRNALGEAYNDRGMAELLGQVLGESVEGLVKSIAPGVGLVKSASKTLFNGLATYSKTRLVLGMRNAEIAFSPGDPEAAFTAVRHLAKRELAKSSLELTTHAAETGIKASGMFFDGATASTAAAGTAATIARLLCTLKYLKRDWSEKKAANRLLSSPHSITNELFNQNPLLGCYFVACATDSVLLNFMFDKNMALPSFMDKIERATRKHLDPTRKAATHCILNHRMALSGEPLPKLSVVKKGHDNQIAVRSPATYQHITASAMNKVKRRPKGYYK